MRRLAFLVVLGLLAVPAVAAGQERLCHIDAPGRTDNSGGGQIVLHDPFTVTCEDGAQLRAESGRANQPTSEIHLIGSVYFEDAEQTLTSNEATYNRRTGRLWATGDVVFTNRTEGSTLRGPELEYFRANNDRPLSQVIAPRRPTLLIQPRNRADDTEPLNLVADRVMIVGEDDLSAFGSVVITRTEMEATSEEARYNSTTEDLELRRNSRIRSEDYDLSGEVIQAKLTEGSLEHVHSRTNAVLSGNDLRVTAPDLQLFFAADSLRRAVARSPVEAEAAQALARSRDFEMQADSIDASFVDQLLREVWAVGSARAETMDSTALAAPPALGDSVTAAEANPDAAVPPLEAEADVAAVDSAATTSVTPRPLLASDWVRGDTIIGYFEPVAPAAPLDVALPDTAGLAMDAPDPAADPAAGDEADPEPTQDVDLRKLVAIGSAQSLYRMTPEDRPDAERKDVSFLVGKRIELDLVDGELEVASVTGLEQGVYLEATAEAAPPTAPVTPVSDTPGPGTPAAPQGGAE